jgi:hypothetical protein
MNADQLRRDIADLETAGDVLARLWLLEMAGRVSLEIGCRRKLLAAEERRLLSALKEKGVMG